MKAQCQHGRECIRCKLRDASATWDLASEPTEEEKILLEDFKNNHLEVVLKFIRESKNYYIQFYILEDSCAIQYYVDKPLQIFFQKVYDSTNGIADEVEKTYRRTRIRKQIGKILGDILGTTDYMISTMEITKLANKPKDNYPYARK
jgi:hypothetical protein